MKRLIGISLAISLLSLVTSFSSLHAQMDMNNKASKSEQLRIAMHKLWEDHIVWTRNVILNIMDDLPGIDQAVARLLQNQDDIGNAVKPFYGEAGGHELTRLLREHITVAADLLKAAKTGNNSDFDVANKKWIANADEISGFLSKANPNWKLQDMKKMMHDHLNLTTEEAVARLKKDYAADVKAYDKVHDEILLMADMLTDGILKQFPAKFK
ncbi:MAG TPA: hypothetical protein VFU29_10180 [Chitinophagaceae bacterium]|nr:hypothetical protein [Chitinophagaceae bacterium]